MGDERNGTGTVLGITVDYKTLFLGACSLVVLLGGGLYGKWNRDSQHAIEDTRATTERQWQRLSQLEARLIEYGAQVQQLRKEADDREERIRAIERQIDRLTVRR